VPIKTKYFVSRRNPSVAITVFWFSKQVIYRKMTCPLTVVEKENFRVRRMKAGLWRINTGTFLT